ncbi:hypothetical protein [Enterobacter sp. C4G1]|uniref:hypothetical protein n=1 Tax=Enterobacter sp. C4G1 TaxID=3458724 RepID=UPI00406817FA
MTPAEKMGAWWLRFFGFFIVFAGCLLIDFDNDFLLRERLAFGDMSENRWNDLVVGGSSLISALVIFLIVCVVSGKKEAFFWLGQICIFLAIFAGIYASLPEQLVSFFFILCGAFALTSLVVFMLAKRRNI